MLQQIGAIPAAGVGPGELRLPVPVHHGEAPLETGAGVATVCPMPPHSWTHNTPDPGRSSHQVIRLIDRIKRLVAEQRRLDESDGDDRRRDANRREIARLKWRLANVVKRELSPGAGLRLALAFRP
jgi:hypothetical protein